MVTKMSRLRTGSRELKDFRRKTTGRQTKDRILIVCEGEKTEPKYFLGFRLTNVKVIGAGDNTENIVRLAIKLKEEAKRERESYNQIWCVFDRDSFPAQHFNNAISLAHQNDIKVGYSNEAFELWYLLHYNYYDSAISRTDYINKLSELLGYKYV